MGGFCPGEENKELWKEADEYIRGRYETKILEEIRFQSDGGGWMKEGVEKLGATFVLDGFHLRKYMKRLCRLTGKEEEIRYQAGLKRIRESVWRNGGKRM